jgi:site-specific DNA recombinase
MASNMFGVVNQYHSDVTREKTVQATTAKAKAGYLPTHAPPGYYNCDNPDKNCEKIARKIIIPHPTHGPLITEAFKLYATGRYNVYELNDLMYEKGLRSQRGKKLPESVMYNLLKNRLYLGEIHWKNIIVKDGKHEPLIDEATFNQVQKLMRDNNGGRCRRRKYKWLLNGYVYCPIHERRFTAEWHINKLIAYYHCPACRGRGLFVEKTNLEKQVAHKLRNLEFSQTFIDSVISKVKGAFENRRNEYQFNQRSILNSQNAIYAKMKSVEDRMLDGTLPKERYIKLREEADISLKKLEDKLNALKKVNGINVDIVSEILNFTKDIMNTYMKAPEHIQKQLIGFFFDKFEVKNGLIIKTHYSPLFENLLQLKHVVYKTRKTQKTRSNNAKSKVILRRQLGA